MRDHVTKTATTTQTNWIFKLALITGLSVAGIVVSPPTVSASTTIIVTTRKDFTRDDAVCSLREAIVAANTDTAANGCPAGSGTDTITLQAAGEYFLGTPLAPIVGDVVIDGNDRVITSGHTARVLQVEPGATASINNLTLTAGQGFYNQGTASLSNVSIVDNNTSGNGAAIFNTGSLTISHGLISGNTADTTPGDGTPDRDGGGIRNDGTLTITSTTISDNSARSGGGIYNSGSVTIANSTILGNTVSKTGGGIYNRASATITGTTISGNNAQNAGGIYSRLADLAVSGGSISDNNAFINGGGIYLSDGQFSLVRNTVDRNTAGKNGGGLYSFAATGTVSSTTFARNAAGNSGGGLHSEPQAPTWIANSTFSDNVAAQGGGISGFGATSITNSTVTGNTADGSGGGVFGRLLSVVRVTITRNAAPSGAGIFVSSNLEIAGSIVSGNIDGADVERAASLGAVLVSGGFNVIGGLGGSIDTFVKPGDVTGVVDPLLRPLADNGGSTLTHAPLAGSPAVDRVTATAAGDPTTDQRGAARPQGPFPDAGAVEVRPPVVTSLEPARYADSRDEPTFDGSFRKTGRRQGGSSWEIDIAGRGLVPTAAEAVVVNVTLVNGAGPGFATVYPCTPTVPKTSSVNYGAGTIDPNEVIAKLSPAGTLCVFTQTTADVLVDVVGHITDSPYVALVPSRYADSRREPTFDNTFRNTGPRRAGTMWMIDIAGRGAVPAAATTAVVNVTVAGATAPGYGTVYPCTPDVPGASSLNYGPGIIVANELVAELGEDGALCVFTQTDVDVIVDVVGYLETSSSLTSINPTRYADSRNEPTFDDTFRNTGQRGANTVWEIQVAGRGAVPANATTIIANLTVTEGAGPGFATVYPCTPEVPTASSLNFGTNTTRPNELIAKLSPTGTICIYTHAATHLLVDVTGHNLI